MTGALDKRVMECLSECVKLEAVQKNNIKVFNQQFGLQVPVQVFTLNTLEKIRNVLKGAVCKISKILHSHSIKTFETLW